MPNFHRLACSLISIVLFVVAGCASSEVTSPDAAVDVRAVGDFDIRSTFVLSSPPPAATEVLGELLSATDGPDDPARYLVDLLVSRLPEGRTRQYAESLAPYLAAYLETKLDTIAPRFAVGVHDLAVGLDGVAHHVQMIEHLTFYADGNARRQVEAVRWGADAIELPGMEPAYATATLAPGPDRDTPYERELSISSHQLRVPLGAMLRAGFDRTVIPRVVPRTFTLASALDQLVDCPRVGALTSEWMGIGSPDFYATACTTAMTALAARVYARLAALDDEPYAIDLSGVARAFDLDADGAVDRIDDGRWLGTFGSATFDGKRR